MKTFEIRSEYFSDIVRQFDSQFFVHFPGPKFKHSNDHFRPIPDQFHNRLLLSTTESTKGKDVHKTGKISVPNNVVKGSDRAWVTAEGDLLALSIEVSSRGGD